MKKLLALVALSLVVFSSGCTVPGLNIEIPFLPDIFGGMNVNEQKHDVISIESLDALPSTTVRSGQSIHLRAVVKNLQAPEYKPVENVEITLFNDCGMFDVTGDFCETDSKFSDKKGAGDTTKCTLTRMHPQYTSVIQWALKARDINVETPCKIGVMAKYNYRTYSTTSVTFINKAELERLVTEGKSFSETGTLSIGEGPVKPYVEVLNQPIIIDAKNQGVNAGSGIMSFWIENKGGGYIDLDEAQSGNVLFGAGVPNKNIRISISSTPISGGGGENIKVVNTDNSQEITLTQCLQNHLDVLKDGKPIGKYSVNFIGKKTPEYSCSIIIPSSRTYLIKQESTYEIMTEIDYSYKFTKEATITVQPKIKL
jgi:hypothetical protein